MDKFKKICDEEKIKEIEEMGSIVMKNEIEEYKFKILKAISEHFENPYCARTDIGKVMYEREIVELINRIKTKE